MQTLNQEDQEDKGVIWSYRSPVQGRDIPRNRWVTISAIAEESEILPTQQLYVRMEERQLEAGFMRTTRTPGQAINTLRSRWALTRGLTEAETAKASFSRVTFGRVAPIFGQIQDPCDLQRWVAAAGRLKCGEADSLAAFAYSRADVERADLHEEAAALLCRLDDLNES